MLKLYEGKIIYIIVVESTDLVKVISTIYSAYFPASKIFGVKVALMSPAIVL